MLGQGDLDKIINDWHEGLPKKTREAISMHYGMLVMLTRLQRDYDLNPRKHFTRGGRVSGQSPKGAQRILRLYDEDAAERVDLEGYAGRSSPGSREAADAMLDVLRGLTLADGDREALLKRWLEFTVNRVRELQNQERMKFAYDRSKPLRMAFKTMLKKYARTQKSTALAQHLVGAKLEVRYEDADDPPQIDRRSVDSRDPNSAGDFEIGQYVFHVSMRPNEGHIAKCVRNLRGNRQPVLLVPDDEQLIAKALAQREPEAGDRIDIKSIEAFVSQNIEELAIFDFDRMIERVQHLIDRYNDRIRFAERKQHYEIEWESHRPTQEDEAEEDNEGDSESLPFGDGGSQ
jgi:hypothetical protein